LTDVKYDLCSERSHLVKRVIFAVLGFLLIYSNIASSKDDNQFHLSLGGTVWNNRWDFYNTAYRSDLDVYNEKHRAQFGYFLKLDIHRWMIGFESLIEKKRYYDNMICTFDETESKDIALDFGYSLYKNPSIKPLIKFRTNIARFYQIEYCSSYEEEADYQLFELGIGIESCYTWKTSGFAIEGRISQSVAGNCDADYKMIAIRDRFKDHFKTDDVDSVDWYAGISYQLPRDPFKIAMGFRKSIDKTKFRTADRNPEVNCSYTSDFEGPVVMISYEF
jgi:hypothetical protein